MLEVGQGEGRDSTHELSAGSGARRLYPAHLLLEKGRHGEGFVSWVACSIVQPAAGEGRMAEEAGTPRLTVISCLGSALREEGWRHAAGAGPQGKGRMNPWRMSPGTAQALLAWREVDY